MAGNIVKWWKHKILGGYKQFTVLQECATDSEELIYHTRAPSALSAPPDLLLISEREQIKVKSPSKHSQNYPTNYQQEQQQSSQQQHHKENVKRFSSKSTKSDQDRVRLEEVTCDVSVEDVKKTQPLQFSFTLYDLDGHGKITKDDIAGIVSTIYESIGKTVVVPHYGSKTINVRLTVSPDGKTKTAAVSKKVLTPRRRYRPRKLISDDDCSDSSDNLPRQRSKTINNCSSIANNFRENNLTRKNNPNPAIANENKPLTTATDCFNNTVANNKTHPITCPNKNLSMKNENIYESINNLKCCNLQQQQQQQLVQNGAANTTKKCCLLDHVAETIMCQDCNNREADIPVVKNMSRRKVVRKTKSSRKHKTSVEDHRPRARSLSVGNENCYQNDSAANQEECWKSSLRRRELIEIIRESMVKNSLCFQPNRKPLENSPKHRHRSHTISKMVGDVNQTEPVQNVNTTPELHLCGYDSYLHKTICSSANTNHAAFHVTTVTSPSLPVTNTPNRFISQKNKRKESRLPIQNFRHQTSSKLSPALLTQLNPNLSAEQKLSRTINQVEKWLDGKDSKLLNKLKIDEKPSKLKRSKSKEEINLNKVQPSKIDNVLTADLLLDKLKITENMAEINVVTPKKAFNKECLISSATKKNIKTHQQNLKANDKLTNGKNFLQTEYGVPVIAEPIECENLIEDDDSHQQLSSATTSSATHSAHLLSTGNELTPVRYVHIHHHYHHFENDEEA